MNARVAGLPFLQFDHLTAQRSQSFGFDCLKAVEPIDNLIVPGCISMPEPINLDGREVDPLLQRPAKREHQSAVGWPVQIVDLLKLGREAGARDAALRARSADARSGCRA